MRSSCLPTAFLHGEEQRLRRLLQPVQEVGGRYEGTGKTGDELLWSVDPRAAVLREEPFIEPVSRADGLAQAGDLSGPEAQDGGDEVAQGLAIGCSTEDVQAASFGEVLYLA